MAFDTQRGVSVLFGGSASTGFSRETWEWDGTNWSLRSLGGPTARAGHSMTYDAARHVVLLWGGFGPSLNADSWEWDGSTWVQRSVLGPNAGFAALAYDANNAAALMYGTGETPGNGETWTWDGSPAYFAEQPQSAMIAFGGQATFHARLVAGPVIDYQWRKNGVAMTDGGPISGATSQTLSISAAIESDAGLYDVIATNPCGSYTSATANLQVLPACVACDVNCDGSVNPFDIQPFIVALSGGQTCSACAGDANANGTVNPFDINAFIACLGG